MLNQMECFSDDPWIPCACRFPENGQRIIVKGHFPFEAQCIFSIFAEAFVFTLIHQNFTQQYIYGVTHWRPCDE